MKLAIKSPILLSNRIQPLIKKHSTYQHKRKLVEIISVEILISSFGFSKASNLTIKAQAETHY